ncbi:hypothetical protein [Bdellovibrio sp. HCB209]|uniref:hypothetical protein n=1 Tax=Bdellovibrio sp. HCB209 TaxID=3394354 RepID=UPI0039B6194D
MENKRHFRRCHHCGTVHSKNDQSLFVCTDCGHELAPLYYSQLITIIQEEAVYFSDVLKGSPVMQERPLIGLTVDWDANIERSHMVPDA